MSPSLLSQSHVDVGGKPGLTLACFSKVRETVRTTSQRKRCQRPPYVNILGEEQTLLPRRKSGQHSRPASNLPRGMAAD